MYDNNHENLRAKHAQGIQSRVITRIVYGRFYNGLHGLVFMNLAILSAVLKFISKVGQG